MILSEEDERGTERIFLYSQSMSDALDETSLPRSQLAYEKEDMAFLGQFPEAASQKLSLFRAMGIQS